MCVYIFFYVTDGHHCVRYLFVRMGHTGGIDHGRIGRGIPRSVGGRGLDGARVRGGIVVWVSGATGACDIFFRVRVNPTWLP